MKRVFFFCAFALSVVLAACMTLEVTVKPAEYSVEAGGDGALARVRLGDFPQPTPKTLSWQSGPTDGGTGGTITIPANTYVTGITTSSTSGGTLAIAEGIGGMDAGDAGSTIIIPAGNGWSFPGLMSVGGLYGLGPGTVLTFTGVTAYFVAQTSF